MHNDAWQESHLGDWVKLLSGGTPPKSDASLWGGSIPWISCKDMKASLLDSSQDWLTEAGASKVRKVPSGTILIVVRGMILANEFPVARCLRAVTFNQDLKAVIPRKGLDEGFLFQWLRGNSYEILGRVDEAGHGTKRLQTDRLLSVPLRLPPLPTQRRIASILSAYDDLIENNTKRIEILEEMARSLYREWFVHFRFPGHEKVKLVDSELGKIPEGWDVFPLIQLQADVPNAINGGPFGSKLVQKDYVDQGVPVIRGANLTTTGRFKDFGYVYVTPEKAETLRSNLARPGDIVVTQRGTLGQVARIPRNTDYSEFVISQSQMKVTFDDNKIDNDYGFYCLKSTEAVERLKNLASSSGVPHINLATLREFQIRVPPIELQRAFGEIVSVQEALIENLTRRNTVLRNTRDLLLPKLISGEIDVDALDLQEELPRSGARRRKVRGKIDGDALDLQETG